MNTIRLILKPFLLISALLCWSLVQAETPEKVLVLRGPDYSCLLDRGISELGGWKSILKEGQRLVLKPDISVDARPNEGRTTSPVLVEYFTRQCYKNKGRAVFVFDYCFDNWTKCYKNTGIERAAKDGAAKVIPGNHEHFFQEQTIPEASVLKHARIHSSLEPGYLLVSMPVLKTDSETTISGALKNLSGCVLDRRYYQGEQQHRALAEFLYYRQPELTVIDATHLLGQTHSGKKEQVLIISRNVLAADAVACRLNNIDPSMVKHLQIAEGLGFGSLSPGAIEMIEIVLK